MRFAYIDSKGKEIELEGVEALALRVELGAITETTRLYDASEDRWAPASEHPIFQTLASKLSGGAADGGAASAPAEAPSPKKKAKPGPPAPKKKAGPPTPKAKKAQKKEEAPKEKASKEEAQAPEPELPAATEAFMGAGLEDAEVEVVEPSLPDAEEPVSFADVHPDAEEAEEAAAPEEAAGADEDAFGFGMELDLVEDPAPAPEEPAAEPAAEGEEAEPAGFDFGSGPIEFEEPPEPEEPSREEPPTEAATPSAEGGGGLALEGALDWAGLDQSAGQASQEAPDREDMFGPEAPRERAEGAPAGEAAEERYEPSPGVATEREEAPVKRKSSAPRPSHWDDRRGGGEEKGSKAKILIPLILVLAAAGAGGYFYLQSSGGARVDPTPTAQLPPAPGIPGDLRPAVAELGGPAIVTLLALVDSARVERGLAGGPGEDWLKGAYFANASQYPEVAAYWEGIRSFVADLRESDDELFRRAYQSRIAQAVAGPEDGEGGGELPQISEEDADVILERGAWEFLAASAEEPGFRAIDSLAVSALALHQLLERRESDIHRDAGTAALEADPILEVEVADEELRREMNTRLDGVLRAVAETDAPAPLTTRGMMRALYERIGQRAFGR